MFKNNEEREKIVKELREGIKNSIINILKN